MTTPPHRPAPRGRPPGGHDEQPTQPLRRVSGQQPYGRHRPSAQQPPYDEHSAAPTRRARPREEQPEKRPEPRARRKGRADQQTAVITGVIAVLALLVAGVGAWALTTDKDPATPAAPDRGSEAPAPPSTGAPAAPGTAADARVGDCVQVTDANETEARVETITCTDPGAVYRVAVRTDNGSTQCRDADYVAYTQDDLLLCFVLNARSGECFHESDQQDTRVSCDSAEASYRVGEIVDGAEDSSRCGEADAEYALTYPEPPLTICRLGVR
jgi:hypothetical protein